MYTEWWYQAIEPLMKVWSSLKFILVAIPKIDAVFANDDQMEFDCDDECRGRAIYIPQTLPV